MPFQVLSVSIVNHFDAQMLLEKLCMVNKQRRCIFMHIYVYAYIGYMHTLLYIFLYAYTQYTTNTMTYTVYPKKYAHGFCFAVLCCDYTLTDFPISIRLTSLALWQSHDCPSASKATLMNMDKYFMWIHYERLHNHSKANHNKTVCIFLGIYCIWLWKVTIASVGNESTKSN